ncbi:hypothetical protein IIA16_04205 [bacterium]|nr:hypothetical protein [bacterium]
MSDRVLLCIPNLLLASQVRAALAVTGHEVRSASVENVCELMAEPWHLVIADLSALGPGACGEFPAIPEETRGVGLITHQDVLLRPRWEAVGFQVVFRRDFFSEMEKYLFP